MYLANPVTTRALWMWTWVCNVWILFLVCYCIP